ncbi:MAG: DUF4091 domain-containing protein [Abditibacteriota bacterium]|nr:DUF4091 domain-containing protein [Abditibacteriota bacterium]
MIRYTISFWQSMTRPTFEYADAIPQTGVRSLICKNSYSSFALLVEASEKSENLKIEVADLTKDGAPIEGFAYDVFKIGFVNTPEAGSVADILEPVTTFDIDDKCFIYTRCFVGADAEAGIYDGKVLLTKGGETLAEKEFTLEVANVTVPDPEEWMFHLNVWMNPGAVAEYYNLPLWSDEHFEMLGKYMDDLAAHGQKAAVVPICYKPWWAQTHTVYPSTIVWKKTDDGYDFDFSVFDRYVELYESKGITDTIHCYSPVQGPGKIDFSEIEFEDGTVEKFFVGTPEYDAVWGAFFTAFRKHLEETDRFDKTYIALDEKTPEVMEALADFIDKYASDFNLAYAGKPDPKYVKRYSDISYFYTPAKDSDYDGDLEADEESTESSDILTTFYVCCGPQHPNTFVHSPLIESRILPMLAIRGGYNGLLRWSYNDWSESPFVNVSFTPEGCEFPSGDTFLVYPGPEGPIPSLRWEQLRQGIQDFELASIALINAMSDEDIADYEHAVNIACRNADDGNKSIGDIEIARRLLIPIAEDE